MVILSSYRIQTVKRQNTTIVFRSSYLKFGSSTTAEAHNGDEETFPIAQEISLRKKPDERIHTATKTCFNLVPFCWEETESSFRGDMKTERKMEPTTYFSSCSLRSVSLSFPPSLLLSFSLSLSLSPLQISCAHRFFLLGSCFFFVVFLDPSSAPQWMREPWEFSQTWRGGKKNLFAAVGANQAWRAAEPFHSGRETKRCYYKNVMNVVIFQQKGGKYAVRCVRCSQGFCA